MRLVAALVSVFWFATSALAQTPLWYPVMPGGGRRKPSKREMSCRNTAAMASDGDKYGRWNSYCNREPMPVWQSVCKAVAFEKEELKIGYCAAGFET